MLRPRRILLAVAGTAVFLFSWFFRFNDPSGRFAGLTDDHFFYLLRGWQILLGELPVRDFVDHGAPLYFYVSAAVQIVFGRGTVSELAFSTTMLSVGAVLTFWLATRASGSLLLGLLGAATHMLLLPRYYNYPKIVVYAVLIPVLWWFADRPGRVPIVWLAIITVVGFLFRHDHGIYVLLATTLMLVVAGRISWSARVRSALLYGALVFALLLPYLAFIQMNGGIRSYIALATEWVEEERERTPVLWPGLLDNPDGVSEQAREGSWWQRGVATIRDNNVAWFYYFELALPLLAFAVLAVSRDGLRPTWPQAVPKIAIVAFLGLILNAGFLRSPLGARLADPSVPHAILIAWLSGALPRLLVSTRSWRPQLQRWRWTVRTATAGVTVPFFFIPGAIFTHDLYDRLENAYLFEGSRVAFARVRNIRDALRRDWDLSTWKDREDRPELITLSLYLNSCTSPASRVFVQPYIPQVLGLARRGFAAGHGDLRPGFFNTPEFEAMALRRMRAQDVPVALLATGDSLEAFRESFPLLTAYFDSTYEVVGTHTFEDRFGITLLVRRDAARTGVFEPLGWPCFHTRSSVPARHT